MSTLNSNSTRNVEKLFSLEDLKEDESGSDEKITTEERRFPRAEGEFSAFKFKRIPWIGFGRGIFVYDKILARLYRSSVYWKNIVNISVRRDGNRYSVSTSGKLLFVMVPRPSPDFPEFPSWLRALLNTPGITIESSEKLDLGSIVIPGIGFIKIAQDREDFDGLFLRLFMDDSKVFLAENKPLVVELPYEINYDKIIKTAEQSSEVKQLFKTLGYIESRSPIALEVTYKDPVELLTSIGFANTIKAFLEGKVKDYTFREVYHKVEEYLHRIDQILRYGILFVGVKNSSVGTFFQSDIHIESLRIYLPDCKLSYGDIYVLSEGIKYDVFYEEGFIEIYDIDLGLGQEFRIPLALNSELLNRVSNKPLKVRIKGVLRNPFDIVTGVIERSSANKIAFGLVYYTPMGYPITLLGTQLIFPQSAIRSVLPSSRSTYLFDIEDEIKFEVLLKSPYKYEFVLKGIDARGVFDLLKDNLESLGFTEITSIEPVTSIIPSELGVRGLSYAMIVYSGNIEGIKVSLRIEILSEHLQGKHIVKGEAKSSSIQRESFEGVVESKVIFRSYIAPALVDGLSKFLRSIYDSVRGKVGEKL